MIPIYTTFADKDPHFNSTRPSTCSEVLNILTKLEGAGYYFRGQTDASRKLFTYIQREWINGSHQGRFGTIDTFIKMHIEYHRLHATTQLVSHCLQLNDFSILSTLQHYGAPTPFLDFSSNKESALFFATDGVKQNGSFETNDYVSIYAWKPGVGPARATTNDLSNWENIIDLYGGINCATQLQTLRNLTAIYIKQDSGKFLLIANPRLICQGGLFLYAPAALTRDIPYEDVFDGKTASNVAVKYDGVFLPKMECLNINKHLVPSIQSHLLSLGVTRSSLGLNTGNWAKDVYDDFLKHP